MLAWHCWQHNRYATTADGAGAAVAAAAAAAAADDDDDDDDDDTVTAYFIVCLYPCLQCISCVHRNVAY